MWVCVCVFFFSIYLEIIRIKTTVGVKDHSKERPQIYLFYIQGQCSCFYTK